MATEAQKRASRKYEANNREKTRIQAYKRTARLFIKRHANIDDLKELKELISLREKEL